VKPYFFTKIFMIIRLSRDFGRAIIERGASHGAGGTSLGAFGDGGGRSGFAVTRGAAVRVEAAAAVAVRPAGIIAHRARARPAVRMTAAGFIPDA
jgi:hypothetical protein